MKKTIRHQAVEILNQVHADHDFAGPLINDCLDKYNLSGTPDGRLLTHLVYGVLRFRGHLDWLLKKLYRGDFAKMQEDIKNVLRVSLYQLRFSERLPDFAVVNEGVEIAKIINPDKSSLVNAILRNFLRRGQNLSFPSEKKNPVEYLAAFHSHPEWMIQTWIKTFGLQETKALCSADNTLPPLTLRVNTLKISRNDLKEKLAAAGFESQTTPYSPNGIILSTAVKPIQKTEFFDKGLLRIQDEGAQLIACLVNPERNESILDACAGAGGKSSHLAALLENKGFILAFDRNQEKITELKKEIIRLGITIIETQAGNVSAGLPDAFRERFDCVLVDAPCSGLGTLRRNPEIKWRIMQNDILSFAAQQKKILQQASAAVKRGGRLIYCTCSVLPEENENIVEHFLRVNNQFSLGKPSSTIIRPLTDSSGFFRTFPHRHNMDGFFGALLIRQ